LVDVCFVVKYILPNFKRLHIISVGIPQALAEMLDFQSAFFNPPSLDGGCLVFDQELLK